MHVPNIVFENSSHPAGLFLPPTACEATDALPGTPEKIAVLAERARHGVPLWHVHDPVALDKVDGSSVSVPLVPASFIIDAGIGGRQVADQTFLRS